MDESIIVCVPRSSSPFTKTGLADESSLGGVSDTKRAQQSRCAAQIYEIFAIYLEKCSRVEECIEVRLKQSRMMTEQFARLWRGEKREEAQARYVRVVEVLCKLADLYAQRIEGGEVEVKSLQQMLTTIQLTANRLQRLSEKTFMDLVESKTLTRKLRTVEELTYKMKNEHEKDNAVSESQQPSVSVTSSFADWM